METQGQGSSTHLPTRPQPLPEAWVAKLQSRMMAIYGHKFSSLFQSEHAMDEWRDTWARALAGVTGEQIAAGLEKLATSTDEWPPTSGEFRAMCKPVIRPEHQRNALLSAPRDTKDRSRELARIREMLASKMTKREVA